MYSNNDSATSAVFGNFFEITSFHQTWNRDAIAFSVTSRIARIHESRVKKTLVIVRDRSGGSPDCCRNRSMVCGEGVDGTIAMLLSRVADDGVATAGVAVATVCCAAGVVVAFAGVG